MLPSLSRLFSLMALIHRFFFAIPQTRSQRFVPVILWGCLIFVLSSLPGSAYPKVTFPFADKIVHAALYAPFGFWLVRSVWNPLQPLKATHFFLAYAVGMAYGLSDEIHQLFVPLRTCSLADWITDCIALIPGLIAWKILVSFESRRNARF